MIKKYAFLIFGFIAFNATSQIVNIPDPLFKNALVSTNCVGLNGSNVLVDADTNNDGQIQTTEALAITRLKVENAGINSLSGIESFTNLTNLDCSGNTITSINFPATFTDLQYIDCTSNSIVALDMSALPNYIMNLDVSSNPLTDLVFPAFVVDLTVNNTSLVSLNLQLYVDAAITIQNNLYLQTIDAKNGYLELSWTDGFIITMSNNPALESICIDDNDELIDDGYHISDYISWSYGVNDPDVLITFYCNFFPGGASNTVTGNVNFDCGGQNSALVNLPINITQDGQTGMTFTNSVGNYSFYGQTGLFVATPEVNPEYFTLAPANFTYDFTDSGNVETANFCISPNGSHPDMQVTLIPLTPARPGFDANYSIILANKGTETQSGSVSLTFDDNVLDHVSSNPVAQVSTSALSWDFTDLAPFNSIVYEFILNVNSPTETPPVNIGDVLPFTASIISTADETPANNTMEFHQTVEGPFDPNDKSVNEPIIYIPTIGMRHSETAQIPIIDDYLHYVVRFQNTGNFYAENVVVRDMLSEKLDWSTLEMISASHPYRSTLTDENKLEVFFEGINLPAVSDDEPGSHGYVAFKIKPVEWIGFDEVIENTANIYFDFNMPIVTNTVTTTVTALNLNEHNAAGFSMYPNPAGDLLTIDVSGSEYVSINFYNLMGQLIMWLPANANQVFSVDVSQLSAGTYFVEIENGKNNKVEKLIKM